MKTKKLIAITASMAILLAGISTGCGNSNSTNSTDSSVSSTATLEPLALTDDDLMELFPSGLDLAILQGAMDLDFSSLVEYDDSIVKSISVDTGILDTDLPSRITITYTITLDAAALAEKLGLAAADGETEITTTKTGKVYIVSPDEASEFLERNAMTIYTTGGETFTPETQAEADNPEVLPQTDPTQDSDAEPAQEPDTSSPEPQDPSSAAKSDSTGSSGNSGASKPSSGGSASQQPAHTHNWQPVYETVHHDEVGHYENQTVSEAWDEPVYKEMNVCSACGATYVSPDDMAVHIIVEHPDTGASYSNQRIQVDTIHHDGVTQEVWVVDQAAYDEQVITGYRCDCGAIK